MKLHVNFENFCNKTSMHGFAELYNSYTTLWKIFWGCICFGACAVTSYQVYNSVQQYISEPTTTTILDVPEEDMFYPSLHLCYWQWFYWVDWNKVQSKGYSKEAVLYSMSFFNAIYSETPLNVTQAKKTFEDTMMANNFSTLTQFYDSIARPVPIRDADQKNFSLYFDEREIIYNYPRNTYMMFCYIASKASMYRYFAENVQDKIISFETFDETFNHVKHILSEAEYNQYLLHWVERLGTYTVDKDEPVNLTTFAPPITLLLFNNKAKGLEMVMDNDGYLIDVRASVFTWLSKTERQCNTGFISTAFNTTCQNLCEAETASKECNCLRFDEASLLEKDTVETPICRKDINHINKLPNNGTADSTSLTAYTLRETQTCSYNASSKIDECTQECVPACQSWNYEKSVTMKQTSSSLKKYAKKSSTKVLIQYPRGEDVIIMTEQNAQTWETFIGNVGGILGIWTGASIVSFIQLVYLCCFDGDKHCSGIYSLYLAFERRFVKTRNKKKTIETVEVINTTNIV